MNFCFLLAKPMRPFALLISISVPITNKDDLNLTLTQAVTDEVATAYKKKTNELQEKLAYEKGTPDSDPEPPMPKHLDPKHPDQANTQTQAAEPTA